MSIEKSRSRMELCTRMARQLLLKEFEKGNNKNLVLSPLSIDVVLNMVAAGSRGSTLDKMLGLLGFKNIDEITSQSLEMMALAMNAQFEEVVNEINSWAEAASRGLIKNFLQRGSLSRETAFVLANGLYFKGNWKHDLKFDANLTENRPFYLLNGDSVSVPYMTSRKRYRRCRSFDGFKVLHIPYQSNSKRFSMYFLLPDERDGLQNLLEKIISDSGNLHQYRCLSQRTLDEFWIPKFKFSFDFDVSSTMEDMGMSFPFMEKPEDVAEMVEIPKGVPVFLPRMVQKAFIEVDEKGTEASAITMFGFPGASSNRPEKTTFVADHPFMFMIMEDISRLVIFTGAVLDPSKVK